MFHPSAPAGVVVECAAGSPALEPRADPKATPLPPIDRVTPEAAGLRPDRLDALCALIESHVADGRYPGAQVAVARHGKLALARTFGLARTDPHPVAADDGTLWRIYSSTKVLVANGLWLLVEDGALSFNDPVAMHIPGFAKHGKGGVTIHHLLTHQAGFPSALNPVDPAAWEDRALLRRLAADIELEWSPGSRVHYHRRAAHWVAALVIEAVAGIDFRAFLRTRLIEPAGLTGHVYVGLPAHENARTADTHMASVDGSRGEPIAHVRDGIENGAQCRAAGIPGSGGIATAAGMAAYYQMLLNGGKAGGRCIVSPRTIAYVTRDFTGDAVDGHFKVAMHRGLGPHLRGGGPVVRGMGTLAHPSTFGHGGVGTSYCWADPASGVSFAYLTNSQVAEPWHSQRLEVISNCVHSAIGEPR